MALEFIAVGTRVLLPPRDDVFALFESDGFRPVDGDLLFLATKCLAIHQGRCVAVGTVPKERLVAEEADRMIPGSDVLTIKDAIPIAYSGIDESNGNGCYILWPKDVAALLREIHGFLCKKFSLGRLGLVSVDSRVEPLRRGTVGVAQGIFGFNPVKDCRGNPDIFGRPLRITFVNIADSLAATACYLMGEGAERRPLVLVRGTEDIEFGPNFSTDDLKIPPEMDLFSKIFRY